jgi:hypothetical protein
MNGGFWVGLTILALVVDGLCMALLAAVFFLTRPTPSAILGVSIFVAVIFANVPPLILGLVHSRRSLSPPTPADIFQ